MTMVKIPEVTAKYTGIIKSPLRTECFRSSTRYLVRRKMTAAKPPAIPGAMNQAEMIADTPLALAQPHSISDAPAAATVEPMMAPTME